MGKMEGKIFCHSLSSSCSFFFFFFGLCQRQFLIMFLFSKAGKTSSLENKNT